MSGTTANQPARWSVASAAEVTYLLEPESFVVMVKTSPKPIWVELKQFVSLTSAMRLSPGSAKMMSTH